MSELDGARPPAPAPGPTSVLFVCTHNSARSILAEALLRHKGGDAFEVFSAGTQPGQVRPYALQVLSEAGIPTEGLRSKSVQEFLDRRFDFVITVCDRARQECPVFPGAGKRLHWGYDDPSAVEGSEEDKLAAYGRVFTLISARLDLFLAVERRKASTPASQD